MLAACRTRRTNAAGAAGGLGAIRQRYAGSKLEKRSTQQSISLLQGAGLPDPGLGFGGMPADEGLWPGGAAQYLPDLGPGSSSG